MSASFNIREAAAEDFREIAEFLRSVQFGPAKPEWLRWKYLENPSGRARVFLMSDHRNSIKGLIAYLPRQFANGSQEHTLIMQAVDGVLAPDARGKGLYPKLLQYSMEKVRAPLLGFPNKRAEELHVRCNWNALAEEDRWEFPGAIGFRFQGLSGWFASPVNAMSKLYSFLWLRSKPTGVMMKPVKRFENSFSLHSEGMAGVRSAEFLNWRFIDNPMRSYFCHEYYVGAECIGYSACGMDGLSAELFDFVTARKRRECLKLLVEHCRNAGITYILFRGVGLKLRRYGFLKKRGCGNYISFGLPKGNYTITMCDSDW